MENWRALTIEQRVELARQVRHIILYVYTKDAGKIRTFIGWARALGTPQTLAVAELAEGMLADLLNPTLKVDFSAGPRASMDYRQ